MIEEWIRALLSRNGVPNAESLTPEMIHDEIQEIKDTIRNEKLWALGAPTEPAASVHIGNIEAFEEYIEYLESHL